jgi:hypothetical protein
MMTEIVTHYGMLFLSGFLVVVAAVLAAPSNPDKNSRDGQAERDDG